MYIAPNKVPNAAMRVILNLAYKNDFSRMSDFYVHFFNILYYYVIKKLTFQQESGGFIRKKPDSEILKNLRKLLPLLRRIHFIAKYS